jgi:hypothetical protein
LFFGFFRILDSVEFGLSLYGARMEARPSRISLYLLPEMVSGSGGAFDVFMVDI